MTDSIGSPARPRTHPVRGLAASAVTLGCAVLVLAGCSGASTQDRSGSSGDQLIKHDKTRNSYGALPTYLPSNTVDNNAPIRGTAARPAVTSEGDQVLADVAGAHVVAEVDGPVVPGEGLPDPPETTTCTWTITIRTTGRSLPLSVQDFNSLDHLGTIYRMAAVPGRPRIPTVVRPGHSVRFEVRAVMPTGEGVMRWAPDRQHILGEWDFTVEND